MDTRGDEPCPHQGKASRLYKQSSFLRMEKEEGDGSTVLS